MPWGCHVPPRSFPEDELRSFMWFPVLRTESLNGARPANQHQQHWTPSSVLGCHGRGPLGGQSLCRGRAVLESGLASGPGTECSDSSPERFKYPDMRCPSGLGLGGGPPVSPLFGGGVALGRGRSGFDSGSATPELCDLGKGA